MNKMQQKTAEFVKEGQTVVVAVSGGADSMALLHCLCHCGKNLSLIVAHLNHQLRGKESFRDQTTVMDYCRAHHLLCIVKTVNIARLAKKTHRSAEQCGREQRYRFFESVCPQGGVIATAHTLSDQAETVLFRLARGSHMNGLCGIPEKRGNIIRPLLHFSRSQVETYCKEFSLPYQHDSTNFQMVTPRNQIRTKVTPVLKAINPQFEKHLGSFTKRLALDEDYLQKKAQKAYQKLYSPEKGLIIEKKWNSLHPALQSRVLAQILKDRNIPLSEALIQRLFTLTQTGSRMQLSGRKTAEISKEGTLKIFENPSKIEPFYYPLSVKEPNFFKNLQNLEIFLINFSNYAKILREDDNSFISALDYDKIVGKVVLRQRKSGDWIALPKRPTKSVKKWMNEEKIPVFMRDRLGILEDEEGIIWVQNIGVSQRVSLSKKSNSILLLRWQKAPIID